MNINLLHDAFTATPDREKYLVLGKIKKVLAKHAELKAEYGHPFFIEALQFHNGVLEQELDGLENFLKNYRDVSVNGFDAAPQSVLNGRYELIKEIEYRIFELRKFINENEKEIKKRKGL